MKTAKTILMAIIIAGMSANLAQAGSTVKINSTTTIKAAVKNNTRSSASAAVKLTGYNNAGVIIGTLCKSAYLVAGRTTTLDFPWIAPNYATGIYWSSKVEVGRSCPSTVVVYQDHDDHEYDDHEYEDDDRGDD